MTPQVLYDRAVAWLGPLAFQNPWEKHKREEIEKYVRYLRDLADDCPFENFPDKVEGVRRHMEEKLSRNFISIQDMECSEISRFTIMEEFACPLVQVGIRQNFSGNPYFVIFFAGDPLVRPSIACEDDYEEYEDEILSRVRYG